MLQTQIVSQLQQSSNILGLLSEEQLHQPTLDDLSVALETSHRQKDLLKQVLWTVKLTNQTKTKVSKQFQIKQSVSNTAKTHSVIIKVIPIGDQFYLYLEQ